MPEVIFINGKFLSKQVTGVQRYALALLRSMDSLLDEAAYSHLRLVCLVPHGEHDNPGWKNIPVWPVGLNQDNLWEQFDLPYAACGHLLFSPGNTGPLFFARQVVTLHDASTFAVPGAYSLAFRLKYQLSFHLLARIARLVLTDSEFSRQELARHLGLDQGRFRVILLGGDHLREVSADTGILQRHGLSSQGYFLSVASQSAHKNFASVLRVAAGFNAPMQFAAAGGSFTKVFQQTRTQPVPENVRMLGYVNDRELKALYENALGFVFPSMYEGFGLPVLEAMSCGCPVLCSTAASLPEVAGQAALYFDPLDTHALAALLRKFLADPALQLDLRDRGWRQVRAFPWEKTARETLDALVSCLSIRIK